MINKSLIYITCETYILCGISTSFPVLSPNQRQVAHALLTRPPLSLLNASRRINSISSVRLECVMHAASVHPEPGSNSLNVCITTVSFDTLTIFLRAFFTSFFLLLSSDLFRLGLELSRSFCLSFIVQFSRTICALLFERFVSIPYTQRFCQVFFKDFFGFFANY